MHAKKADLHKKNFLKKPESIRRTSVSLNVVMQIPHLERLNALLPAWAVLSKLNLQECSNIAATPLANHAFDKCNFEPFIGGKDKAT